MKKGLLVTLALFGLSSAASGQTPSADDSLTRSRAIQTIIWGMPAVNFDLMFQAMRKAGGKENQIVYWSRLLDWKNQTLTPNPSTIYLMPFINTKDEGPMVLEIPAATGGSVTGTITDAWQNALEDVGPAGADKGRGAKYLILPPDYRNEVPKGYIVVRPSTYMTGPLLRSNVTSGSAADLSNAVAYGLRVKLYPLSRAASPPKTTFIDAIDSVFDSTIPYDVRYFEALDRFVQREPWLDRDKAMIDQIKSVGIERGKPFNPDARKREVLEQAAREAKDWLDVRYEGLFTPYYEGGRWALPVAPDVIEGLANNFSKAGVYPVDDRGAFYSFAYSSVKHLGSGQFYLVTIKDKAGAPFRGADTYRLNVPANAPVDLYWSATAYDRQTHALIKNVMRTSRGSNNPEVQKNADGSFEVYFGPKAPAGKDGNWVPTDPERGFEVMMRFYGPRKPLFDKSWRLPDIEKLDDPAATKRSSGVEAHQSAMVTVDNFVRAETDLYFQNAVKGGGFGGWHHIRELLPIDHQTVIRGNRDTLYSTRVFDLDAGPATVTLPDADRRFMSLQIISEDQYTTTEYGAGPHTLDKARIGTRYALAGVRTLVDPNDPEDIKRVHALQDAIEVSQPGGPGKFEIPDWDKASQKKVREALLVLAGTVSDTRRAFGTRDEVDPVQYLIGAASAWGANAPRDAIYLNVVPDKNDGTTEYKLTVADVPVDGFWSISLYNAEGYYQKNAFDAYTLNGLTAKKNQDGSTTIRFGGCDGKIPNCLPIMKGWNYMVRLYRPKADVLAGKWTFPAAEQVNR